MRMNNITKVIGEQIKFYRQNRGLSQEQLALKANLNVSFLGQVERGLKNPTIETLEKIVIALDITFEEMFSFEKNIDRTKDLTVVDKISFELNGRSDEEQLVIYNLIKQILQFKDKK